MSLGETETGRYRAVAVVQARMGSSRLPGKTMMEVLGRPAIWHLMHRLNFARRLDAVVLATTTSNADDRLADYGRDQGWRVFRGSETDVLDRYYRAALDADLADKDIVVRLTGDDILTDPRLVDLVVETLDVHRGQAVHACNDRSSGVPYGMGVEAFLFEALAAAWAEAHLPAHREHVTPYLRKHPERFPYVEIAGSRDNSHIRLSIDYVEDLAFNRQIFSHLFDEDCYPFSAADIVNCIVEHRLQHPRQTE